MTNAILTYCMWRQLTVVPLCGPESLEAHLGYKNSDDDLTNVIQV